MLKCNEDEIIQGILFCVGLVKLLYDAKRGPGPSAARKMVISVLARSC
jgi:hypothetical protein